MIFNKLLCVKSQKFMIESIKTEVELKQMTIKKLKKNKNLKKYFRRR